MTALLAEVACHGWSLADRYRIHSQSVDHTSEPRHVQRLGSVTRDGILVRDELMLLAGQQSSLHHPQPTIKHFTGSLEASIRYHLRRLNQQPHKDLPRIIHYPLISTKDGPATSRSPLPPATVATNTSRSTILLPTRLTICFPTEYTATRYPSQA